MTDTTVTSQPPSTTTRPLTPALPPFQPLMPPPSDHHPLNQGLGTEMGDSARSMMTKINAGFEHVYSLLTGARTAVTAKVDSATGGLSGEASGLITALNKRVAALEAGGASAVQVSASDFEALQARLASVANAVEQHAAASSTALDPAVFTKLQSDVADITGRFDTLAGNIENLLGLKAKKT